MNQSRHVAFNPQHIFSLQPLCDEHERAGWSLMRVIWWSAFEAIAVFERAPGADTVIGT